MRNRYGAWCRRCNRWVDPGEGLLLTWDEAEQAGLRLPKNPQYLVVHNECLAKPAPQQTRAAEHSAEVRP